jgi:hypothetical protein
MGDYPFPASHRHQKENQPVPAFRQKNVYIAPVFETTVNPLSLLCRIPQRQRVDFQIKIYLL